MISSDKLYAMLLEEYGTPPWWSDDPFTVVFQSVLVQNTSWRNVVKTTEAMGAVPTPEEIIALDLEALEDLIRPCGFFHSKAMTIKSLAVWWEKHRDSDSVPSIKLRSSLLSIRGVGEETADVILLYALHRPVFVVDAYTRRLLSRIGCSFRSDDDIRGYINKGLPLDALVYGQFHWLVLQHCIAVCRKKAECSSCCLCSVCGTGRKSMCL